MIKEIAIAVGVCMAIGGIIACVFRYKNDKIVQKYSQRLRELKGLNQRTMFYGGEKKTYEYHQPCNSKRQLDNLEMEEYLISVLDENKDDFTGKVQEIQYNRHNYTAYLRESELIVPMATKEDCAKWKIPFKTFLRRERRLFKKALLPKPLTEISVHLKVSYTSPQGKNYYEKECTYTCEELEYYLERLEELKRTRKTRQYQIKMERAKMTDSLRYDILKRDNFRCQLCGSTAQDGVKLHVDHIYPIAKGGKTTPENLRTLCDRCNMGKSDKYE